MITSGNDSATSIMRNRYAVTALVLLLSSCQSAGPTKPAAPARSTSWQTVERVGEVRFRAPGAGHWTEIMARDEIPAASTLVTGAGGRLILARPGRQIVVGTEGRLRLPQAGRKAPVEQTEGRVRYRIAGSPAAFAVATPALNVQATDAVLEVSVGAEGTEVTVEAGEARVAAFDGRSVGVVAPGGSARAGGARDAGLMVRGAPGQDYQRVEPVLASSRQPALQPAAKRSLEAKIGARAASPDPVRADDDGGPELVVVPAGYRRAPDRPDPPSRLTPEAAEDHAVFTEQTGASSDPVVTSRAGAGGDRDGAQPGTADHPRTPENDSTGAPPADTPADRFVGFTDGLLGSLPAVSPDRR